MPDQTIVAVYDTPAHAELAVQDLLEAGVPEAAVHRHAPEGSYGGTSLAATPRSIQGNGFWASIFGGEPDHDVSVYDRSVSNGSNAVSVLVPDELVAAVLEILDSHQPIDLDERAGHYGLSAPGGAADTAATASDESSSLSLSEETLTVGKRVVNKGTTRIRRFVVETPVEEAVALRDERVTIERRPVTDGRPLADSFSDKVIEVTETAEEAVVAKTARVVEEVVLNKQGAEHTETIRDTVRREDVEVVKTPVAATSSAAGVASSS